MEPAAEQNDVKVVDGAQGFDYEHRQKVANQYRVSAVNKSRLKFCIFMHFLLFFVLLTKLSQDILDRLEIFVMELEELMIPKPLLWEWLWCAGLLFSFTGLSAIKKNNPGGMKFYVFGIVFFGFGPIAYGAWRFYADLSVYAETRELKNIQVWQGMPVSVLWYIFIVVAFQIHVFSVYFAVNLIRAWKARGSKKTQ